MNSISLTVRAQGSQVRLDKFLAQYFKQTSRQTLLRLIKSGDMLVNHQQVKPSYKVKENDLITGILREPQTPEVKPQNIPLDILYEDDNVLVINKPAGLVVHPGAGHTQGTLVNAIAYYYQKHQLDWESIPRVGLVHRLDKETSGVIIVAKNIHTQAFLSSEFKARRVHKAYWAITAGAKLQSTGQLDTLISRNPRHRIQFSTEVSKGKKASTHFEVLHTHKVNRYDSLSLLKVMPLTGRTHQIRVHMKHLGAPILGDDLYADKKQQKIKKWLQDNGVTVKRQMLHARSLIIRLSQNGKNTTFQAPLPDDFNQVVDWMK